MATVNATFTGTTTGGNLVVPTRQGNSTATLDGTPTISITGVFVATILLEQSRDGTEWFPMMFFNAPFAGFFPAFLRAPILQSGVLQGGSPSFPVMRLRCTAFTSGTATTSYSN